MHMVAGAVSLLLHVDEVHSYVGHSVQVSRVA